MRIGYNKNIHPERYGAVILAAGLSSRMKEFKPLLHVDGRTAIAGLAETLAAAGVRDILTVSGHSRDRLREELGRLQLIEAVNEGYEEGMFTSIQTGLAKAIQLWPEKAGYLLIPVDCPLISMETLQTLMAEHDRVVKEGDKGGSDFLVPTFEGKKGHPLLIPAERAEEIIAYEGPDGLKGITDRDPDGIIRVPVNDEGCVLDMDTPENYEDLQSFANHGFRREKLSVLSSRKKIFLLRHGQTEQHEEPVFIGQYDVPLSEEGRQQAENMAREMVSALEGDVEESRNYVEGNSLGSEPWPALENIYCSDLSRAVETAEIVAEAIRRAYAPDLYPRVVALPGLREIALGEWEGRSIEEIRRIYPEDYARRGEDLFAFKRGNHTENFYDLQYRAVKALRKILSGDDGRNIIIVAHSGIIRALENNLKGLRVDDEWEPLEKGNYRIWKQ